MFARTALHSAVLLTLTALAPACAGFASDDDFGASADGDEFGDDREPGAEGGDAGGDAGDDAGDGDDGRDFRSGESGCEPPPSTPGVCEAQLAELIAGQHTGTGAVTITNDDDSVSVAIQTLAPYELAEVHVFIGTGPLPTNNGGGVAPGQFPYTQEFVEPVTAWQIDVPLDELEVGCDDELTVAVHAVVVAFEDGAEVFEETAWGFGDTEFRNSWGWSTGYEVCCEIPEPPREQGCTLTRGFWQTHNAYAEVEALQQPWPISEDTQLCGQTWLDVLQTEPEGDAWLILAAQTIAAQLNLASGASMPGDVEEELAAAKQHLAACAIDDDVRDEALAISSVLDDYNNGFVGPGHCE